MGSTSTTRRSGSIDAMTRPGKAGAGPNVHHYAFTEERHHSRRVQQVPLPDADKFPRADQPAKFALLGKQLAKGTHGVVAIAQVRDYGRIVGEWIVSERAGRSLRITAW